MVWRWWCKEKEIKFNLDVFRCGGRACPGPGPALAPRPQGPEAGHMRQQRQQRGHGQHHAQAAEGVLGGDEEGQHDRLSVVTVPQ